MASNECKAERVTPENVQTILYEAASELINVLGRVDSAFYAVTGTDLSCPSETIPDPMIDRARYVRSIGIAIESRLNDLLEVIQ